MFRKVSLKTILLLFAALLILVIITTLIDHKKGNRSFKNILVEFNADQIDKIEIYPKVMQGKKVELNKENDRWMLTEGGKKFNADLKMTGSLINELNGIRPASVASNKKERWNEYLVNDSLGTHVRLFSGNNLQADLYLGKFSFSGQSGKSYIRLAGENTTYSVDGFQASGFNRDTNGFKDKTVIHSSKEDWGKLTFSYPADSSFILEKHDDHWQVTGMDTDSAKVAGFLGTLSEVSHYKLSKNEPTGSPLFSLTIEGTNLASPVEVKGYQQADQFLVSSSQNPGVYFEGDDLKGKLFPPRSKFGGKR